MTGSKIGRGFAELPIEEQVQALRDHALGLELTIMILLAAVEKLGVDFVWPGEGKPATDEDDDA